MKKNQFGRVNVQFLGAIKSNNVGKNALITCFQTPTIPPITSLYSAASLT